MKNLLLPDQRILSWQEAGSGPPLVLLHGWSMSSAVFDATLAAFAADYRVLAPDLRGHGNSTPGDGYALDDFCADLTVWFDALDLRGSNLLGWSLGGMVAMRLGQRLPQRIARLLLVATTPSFVLRDDWAHGQAELQVRSLGRNLKRNPVATLADFYAQQFTAEELPIISMDPFNSMPPPTLEAALGGLETLRSADLRPELATIFQPTLVVHGSADPIIPVAAGQALAAALPQAKFHLLSGVGHAPFLSAPEATWDQWRAFLR